MPLERLLQICVAALVVLGTLLRSLAQRDLVLPALILVAAVASIYLTDYRRWIRLPPVIANLGALASVGIALHHFYQLDSAAQLLAIAKLLTLLQVVLLFQEKTPRRYWQMITLSALQVVVGAALNVSLLFGLLLVAYMFLTLLTLSLFFAYRESLRYPAASAPRQNGTATGLERVIQAPRSPRQLVLQPSVFAAGPSGLPTSPAGKQALKQMMLLGLGTLLIATLVFVGVPRRGRSDWTTITQGALNPISGYTPNVKLDDFGAITQNSQLVMRIRFSDEKNASLMLAEPPLLRGSLLNVYDQSGWRYRVPNAAFRTRSREQPTSSPDSTVVRQEITIEPLNEPILFSVYPPVDFSGLRDVQWDSNRCRVFRPQSRQDERIKFVLETTGIYGARQWPLVPQLGPYDGAGSGLPRRSETSQDPPPEIKAVADRVLAAAGAADGDRIARAKVLLDYLRDSGDFEYTLDNQPRDSKVDPIVDFVTNNRRGHCEYFASALCLMLRSQEIPARLVTGFTGEWNPLTEDYQVRQLHAHVWVEMFLEPAEVPDDLKLPGQGFELGGWYTLDPTPGVVAGQTTRLGFFAPLANAVDYAQILWNAYVVGMSNYIQVQNVYQPIADAFLAVFNGVTEALHTVAQRLWNLLSGASGGGSHLTSEAESGDPWRGWLTLAGVIGLVFLVALGMRRLLQTRAKQSGGSRSKEIAVEFYRRWEELLARRGLVRAAGQTPHEFAVSIAPLLARPVAQIGNLCAPSPIAALPRRVVDAFYRVRFGGQVLDNQQREAVEMAIEALEQTMK